MEKKFKLGVIGCGFMSTSIIKGILKANKLKGEQITVSDISEDKFSSLDGTGIFCTTDSTYVANNAEFLLLAVKPQNLNDVLDKIKDCTASKFISILAGTKRSKIKRVFPNAAVARCMPNTPCSIGYGAVAIDVSDYNDVDAKFILEIFSSFAEVLPMSETKMNAVTGISGSGPAYVYLFIEGLIKAGINVGLTEKEARILAVQTVIGSGYMVKNNNDTEVDQLVKAVCSKGGTTIEAVKVYEEEGLNEITDKAVKSCVKRAGELENL